MEPMYHLKSDNRDLWIIIAAYAPVISFIYFVWWCFQ